MHFGLTYSILLHIGIILVMMFGLDYSRKPLPQEETILLELIPISSVTNVKTTLNDVKLDKKKELVSKNDVKQDNKTILKDSEFDNGNASQKKSEPKPIEKTKPEPKKPEPKPELKEEKKPDPKPAEQVKPEPKIEKVGPKPVEKVEPKKVEKPEAKPVQSPDNKEKVPTKDFKKEPEIKKEDKKQEKKPEEKKKSEAPVKKEEPKKDKPAPESKKDDKKAAPKKDDKSKAKPDKKVESSDDELANSVLKSLNEGGKKSSKSKPKQGQSLDEIMENAIKGDTTTDYDANSELSMSEIAMIRSQITQAWRVTSFSGGNNKSMKVTVKVDVEPSGEVKDIKVIKKSPGSAEAAIYNAFVDSVLRAIRTASPLHGLPSEKHSTWSEMEMTFDSSGMIY